MSATAIVAIRLLHWAVAVDDGDDDHDDDHDEDDDEDDDDDDDGGDWNLLL